MLRSHAFLVIALLPAACHRTVPATKPPEGRRVPVVVQDTVGVLVESGGGLSWQTPAQRDSLRAVLKRERDLWRAGAPTNYQFLLRVACFCPGQRGWLLMEVRSGQPLRASDPAGKAVPLSDWNTFSVDGLFDHLEQWADRDGSVQVEFDPRWHFPARIGTTARPGPDRWATYEARGFRPM